MWATLANGGVAQIQTPPRKATPKADDGKMINHGALAMQRLAFVPPNPKLLVRAALTVCCCANFGT